MKITFINQNAKKDLIEIGKAAMDSTREDILVFMEDLDGNEDLGPFDEYGLCFDSVEDDDGEIEYMRYQMSWGGPSDEIRFHPDGKTEYVYLDWFCGVGFDITDTEWGQWLSDYFSEMVLYS